MAEFDFVGVWSFYVKLFGRFMTPQDGDYALSVGADENPHSPANCYNVYANASTGAHLFQSQLNGMYLALDGSKFRASFPQSHAYRFIPTPYKGYTVLYLMDKQHFMAVASDMSCFVVFTDKGGIDVETFGTLKPTTWSFKQFLAGRATDGFTLKYVDLTGYDFPATSGFKDANFSNATFDRASFDDCNLTKANFTDCSFKNASFEKTFTTEKAIFDKANFTGAKFIDTSLMFAKGAGAIFDEAEFTKTFLRKPEFAGASFNQTKFRDVVAEGGDFSGIDLRHAIFDHFIIKSTRERPVLFNRAKLNFPLISYNWQWLDLRDATVEQLPQPLSSAGNPLQATGAKLSGLNQNNFRGVTLADAVLDNSLLDQLDLSNVDLSSASLIQASLHGATLSNVNLHNANLTGAQFAPVSTEAHVAAATLVNAYMPDAVLTGANLFGVLANNIQFYGIKARIDGSAVLEEAQLNNSNLSNLNLTQAKLLGTNLSGSHLFNVRFNKASLVPSAGGVASNLSDANLQGADFTDAQLYEANLSNAAVAIKLPTKVNPRQGGVYLFSLPHAGDALTLDQYTAELDAATASLFSLNPDGDQSTLDELVEALKTNQLKPLKTAFLKHHPAIVISNNVQIRTIELDSVWQLVDQEKSYTLWTGVDEKGRTELYAACSLTNTQLGFHHRGLTLRQQATAAIDKPGQQWSLDNDSQNPNNFSLGYVRFIIVLDGKSLDVYGTAIRIERLGENNKLEMDTENCNVTTLDVTNMNAETICPNGAKLITNQQGSGTQWDTKWLRAVKPPAPPTCVPTDYSWCRPSQALASKVF